MRGQEITPWSIYNKTVVNSTQEGEEEEKKEVVRFPKIKGPEKRGRERTVERGRHSARKMVEEVKLGREAFAPYLSQFVPKEQEKEMKALIQMEGKSSEIERIMDNLVIIQMIKSQLKKEESQLSFMNILKEEQQQQISLILGSNRDRSLLLDRHPFPRVNIDKNVMLVNLSQEQGARPQQRDAEAIKAILKKQISSMISNRMKIMGKSKQLAYKF